MDGVCGWCKESRSGHSKEGLCPRRDKQGVQAGWLMSSYRECPHSRYVFYRRRTVISKNKGIIRSYKVDKCAVCGEKREELENA